mgnify:FL=1
MKSTDHYFTLIQEVMKGNWNAPALTDYDGDHSYTYGQVAEQVARLELMFEHLGIGAGDKVSICGKNCSNWGLAFVAALAHRCVVVSILPDFTTESIHELIRHSDSKLLFVSPAIMKRLDAAQMSQLVSIVSLDDFSSIAGQAVSPDFIDTLMKERYPKGFSIRDVHYPTENFDELALINYTSGSTGSPKGVMLTHRSLSANVVYGQTNIPNHPGQSIVSILPLAHMFGMMFELLYQMAGGTHINFITRNVTAPIMLKAFHDVQPYMILTVPLVIEKIFKKSIFPAIQKQPVKTLWNMPLINRPIRRKVYQKLMDAFGGKLEILIIGGAALNGDVEKCLKQIHFPYTCGYGMTECGPLVCYANWLTYAMKSCGRVVDHLELRVNSDNPYEKEGEILLRGSGVMLGYYKNQQATEEAFLDDGWMRTGDVGVIDHKGNVFLRGRVKNMLLGSNGQNIYPEEIEDKLNSLDGVVESVVVERNGKLVGFVFPDTSAGDKTQIEQLMKENLKRLNELLPNYAKVASIELVDQEFEKTPKKSIKRFMYK